MLTNGRSCQNGIGIALIPMSLQELESNDRLDHHHSLLTLLQLQPFQEGEG